MDRDSEPKRPERLVLSDGTVGAVRPIARDWAMSKATGQEVANNLVCPFTLNT